MILLTGCNTLLGKTLLERLLERGEKVRCYDFYRPKNFPDDIEFFQGDLQDPRQIKKACDGIDTIFHFMDIKRPGKQGRKYMKKINIQGTRNLLFAAQKAKINRFFFLSSYSVYGKPKAIPARQDDRKKPVTSYGKDKLKSENLCWDLITKRNMGITIFRPALVLGPGVKDPIVLLSLYMALGMDDANRLYLVNDGTSKFQFLHHEDAVDAFIAAYDSNLSRGKVYNIGSDNVPTQMEQLLKVKEKLKIDPPVRYISPLKARLLSFSFKPVKMTYFTRDHIVYLLNDIILDCQNIKNELGWEPKKENIEILTETVGWYMKEKI